MLTTFLQQIHIGLVLSPSCTKPSYSKNNFFTQIEIQGHHWGSTLGMEMDILIPSGGLNSKKSVVPGSSNNSLRIDHVFISSYIYTVYVAKNKTWSLARLLLLLLGHGALMLKTMSELAMLDESAG